MRLPDFCTKGSRGHRAEIVPSKPTKADELIAIPKAWIQFDEMFDRPQSAMALGNFSQFVAESSLRSRKMNNPGCIIEEFAELLTRERREYRSIIGRVREFVMGNVAFGECG